MSSPEPSSRASPARARAPPPAAAPGAAAQHPRRAPPPAADPGAAAQHPRSFKLRFAAERVHGHSYQSAVRPLTLPAVVTDKFWRGTGREETDAAAEARALDKVRDMFRLGPREKHARPVQSSHEYGWWEAEASRIWAVPRGDRRLQHGVRDSAWLKQRARELTDQPPQRRR